MESLYIDPSECISCGKCMGACHTGAIVEESGTYRIIEKICFECYHCFAVCPAGAIIPPEREELASINADKSELERILFTRRTSRRYLDKPIPREMIDRLIDAACYAPSVVVKRGREFIVVSDSENINKVRSMTLDFYEMILKYSQNPDFLKKLKEMMPEKFTLITNEELIKRTIILTKKLREGRDTLFYDAPCLVLITADKNSILPRDNCCYALYNMVLLAHSLGIGSCINGIIVNAANYHPPLRKFLQIPDSHEAYTASVFGYPAHQFKNIPPRKRENITWL